MLNRRSLLVAAGLMGLNQLLGGCRATGSGLRVRVLDDAVPVQILQEFQRRLRDGSASASPSTSPATSLPVVDTALSPVKFVVSQQLDELFKLLQTWKNPSSAAPKLELPAGLSGGSRSVPMDDLIMLGDYWLSAAIQQNLIQPLPLEALSGWQQVPSAMQQLVRRDRQGRLDPAGELWAAPYRWSHLVIAYNVERFKQLGWQPTDWQDLWRPELQGQISLPDSARAVIGLTLKKLGQSANLASLADDPAQSAALANELKKLQQQVKFYGANYLQPLLLGDSWLAVGWSTEVVPIADRDRRIAAVVPTSGTLLSADLWVRPARSNDSPRDSPRNLPAGSGAAVATAASPELAPSLSQWLEFCWQPEIAAQISLLSAAASPVVLASPPPALQQRPVVLPPSAVMERSEFLLPLSDPEAYRRLWVAMRQV